MRTLSSIVAFIILCSIQQTHAAAAAVKSPKDLAHLSFRGLPENAQVKINDSEVSIEKSQSFSGPEGTLHVQIDTADSIIYDVTFSMAAGDRKIIDLSRAPHMASLDILSDPVGAEVYINNRKVGTTPFTSDSIDHSGRCFLEIKQYGYETIIRSIPVVDREVIELTFEMQRSTAWKDSVAAARQARKQTRQFIQKTLFGIAGIALAAAGAWYDDRADENISASVAAGQNYDRAAGEFAAYKNEYYACRENARHYIQMRNTLYAAAAGSGAAFGVSFAF